MKLLVALACETNEEEAELAVKELIDIGRVKPMETCKSAEAVAKGLKRDFNAEGLLTSEEALYWRMILQHLAARPPPRDPTPRMCSSVKRARSPSPRSGK